MTIQEARSFIGAEVALSWRDRKGEELQVSTKLFAVDFVPLYGPCLITDAGEIRLDRVVACLLVEQKKTA